MDWEEWADKKPKPFDILVALIEALVVGAAVVGIGCYIL